MAALATFALVSTFQRTTFAVASILVPLSLLAFRRIGLRAPWHSCRCSPRLSCSLRSSFRRLDPDVLPDVRGPGHGEPEHGRDRTDGA